MTLGDALAAPRDELESEHAGRLSYYADTSGSGRPLVLVHSVNACASAYEVKPLFDHYRGLRPVFALDLPGFGHSERGDRPYTAELYRDALIALLSERVGEPADVVALSLSSEFAAAAALQRPESVASLVLISPTGLGHRAPPDPQAGRRVGAIFGLPILSDVFFAVLTVRRSIRYFLGLNFRGRVPEEMVEYAHHAAHQPGAKHAPIVFLSFTLFSREARALLYEPLERPVLVIYDEDPNLTFEALPELLRERPGWKAERVRPTLGLPHWEELGQTTAAMDRFWSQGPGAGENRRG